MNWIVLAVIIAFIFAFFFMNRSGLVREQEAKDLLRQGGKIIDVRTPSEFQHGHLAGAINIPLNELRERIPAALSDKNQPLLLHCAAGGRSAIACRILKQAGYTRSYNLGSYARANRLVFGQA